MAASVRCNQIRLILAGQTALGRAKVDGHHSNEGWGVSRRSMPGINIPTTVGRLPSGRSRTTWSPSEREIDELVYALYGLTPEEIKIVEGAAK